MDVFQAVDHAVKLLETLLSGPKKPDAPQQHEPTTDVDKHEEVIDCPAQLVGGIVGYHGNKIRRLEEMSR